MGIENVIKAEMLSVNRGIIKKRKSILKLLEDPYVRSGRNTVKINEECIKKIAEKITRPLDSVFLPVSFFIPAGVNEAYLAGEIDARVVEALDVVVQERNGRYWVKKYEMRRLIANYYGCFQSIIVL